MKSVWPLWVILLARGATGFYSPISLRPYGEAQNPRSLNPSPSTRLHMSTLSSPKFSLSLMDDTRVSFKMERENLEKLAAEVGPTSIPWWMVEVGARNNRFYIVHSPCHFSRDLVSCGSRVIMSELHSSTALGGISATDHRPVDSPMIGNAMDGSCCV